jgi:hypothetical protein
MTDRPFELRVVRRGDTDCGLVGCQSSIDGLEAPDLAENKANRER